MPNFLIIGAAKSGTTSLWMFLAQHPEIFMSPIKEPHFFAFEGQSMDFRGPADPQHLSKIVTTLEAYRTLFQNVSNQKAIGEASPGYLYLPDSAACIQKYVPDMKMVAILRNPIDRAFSNFVFMVQLGHEPLTGFRVGLEQEETRIHAGWSQRFHYKRRGLYYGQVKAYVDRFDPAQVRIYLYEDFVRNPMKILQDIFRFLDVNDRFVPDLSRKHNASGFPKNHTLHRFLIKPHPVESFFKQVCPRYLRRRVSRNLFRRNLERPQLDPAIRQMLINTYREDTLQLQDLLNRDLGSWLESPPLLKRSEARR